MGTRRYGRRRLTNPQRRALGDAVRGLLVANDYAAATVRVLSDCGYIERVIGGHAATIAGREAYAALAASRSTEGR